MASKTDPQPSAMGMNKIPKMAGPAVFVLAAALLFAHSTVVATSDLFVPGRLFVADGWIRVYEPSGTLAATISLPVSPRQAADIGFNYARNLLYVSDRWGKIYVVDRTGSIVQTLQPPSGPEQLFGIEIADDGTTYVVGSDQRVHVFTSAGVYDRAIVVPTWCLFVALSTD